MKLEAGASVPYVMGQVGARAPGYDAADLRQGPQPWRLGARADVRRADGRRGAGRRQRLQSGFWADDWADGRRNAVGQAAGGVGDRGEI